MKRFPMGLMGALLAAALATVATGQSQAKAPITRSERCSRLSRQLDEAIEKHARTTQVVTAKAFQKKAVRYCAERKQAQGIRTLANALKLLGVKPIDPNQ